MPARRGEPPSRGFAEASLAGAELPAVAEFLGIDHLDVRVASLALVEPFYDRLLPALGLERKSPAHVSLAGDWLPVDDAHPYNAVEYYEASQPGRCTRFIGIIEHPSTLAGRTRIAFAVAGKDDVRAWVTRLREFGALDVELDDDFENYPAVFFTDPAGTRLEICARNVAT